MACQATGVTMRPESSIVELGELASEVAIAASVSEISDSSCHSDLRSIKATQLPPARVTCSRTLLGAKQLWPARPSPTRPQDVLGFEELLSELIARARMLRPHLGSRPVTAPLTSGVHCRTLSGKERCGRMIANPLLLIDQSPALGARGCRCVPIIVAVQVLERCCERIGYFIGGWRLLSVLSRWRDLQNPGSIEVLSAILGRGADRSS